MALAFCSEKFTIFILIIFTSVWKVCTCTDVKCGVGWIQYKERCYYFEETFMAKWDRAKSFCRDDKHACLVSINDPDVNSFLFRMRQYSQFYWIGLQAFQNDKWGWNDGTVDMGISWGKGEHKKGRTCAHNKFNTYECGNSLPAVCERDTNPHDGKWVAFNQHWYYVLGYSTQMQAAQECVALGSYLARLTTREEQSFVKENLNRSHMWFGLTRLVWDDGSGYNWNNWTHEQYPTDSSCVALFEGSLRWEVKGCNGQYHFICSRDLPTTTTMTYTTSATTQPTKGEIATSTPKGTTFNTETFTTPKFTVAWTTSSMTKTATSPASTVTNSARQPTTEGVQTSEQYRSTTGYPRTVPDDDLPATSSSYSRTYISTSEKRNGVGTTPDNAIINNTFITEQVTNKKDSALLDTMYVIYTLIVIMLVTDLVLLIVYLNMKKKSKSTVDDRSLQNDEETSLDMESMEAAESAAIIDNSPQVHDDTTFPIYSVPNKPRAKLTDDKEENPYPEIPFRSKDFPVYAVPNKHK